MRLWCGTFSLILLNSLLWLSFWNLMCFGSGKYFCIIALIVPSLMSFFPVLEILLFVSLLSWADSLILRFFKNNFLSLPFCYAFWKTFSSFTYSPTLIYDSLFWLSYLIFQRTLSWSLNVSFLVHWCKYSLIFLRILIIVKFFSPWFCFLSVKLFSFCCNCYI